VTWRFELSRTSFVETSFRFHRTEHDHEYSFRILGVAKLRVPPQ
jgi:hypothetical protein